MAKVKFAEGVTPPVGKRFGFTFMPNHYGQSVLYHEKNDRCRYPAQKFRNANMDRIIRNWRNQTAPTKSSWETFITTYPQLCKNGIDNLTAFQLWLKRNYYLLLNYGNNTPFMVSPSLTEVTNDPVAFELKLESGRLKLYYTFQNNTSDLIASVFLSNYNYESHYFNRFQSRYMGYIVNSDKPIINFGNLYNFYCASSPLLFAPAGWHVPTTYDYLELLMFICPSAVGQLDNDAALHLKEIGLTYWEITQPEVDNNTLFSARGSGARLPYGGFSGLFQGTHYWNNSGFGTDGFISSLGSAQIYFNTSRPGYYWIINPVNYGNSIRLIKDDSTNPGTMSGNDETIYKTIKIGNQVWTSENSIETLFRDLSPIPYVENNSVWSATTEPAYCYYGNLQSNSVLLPPFALDITQLYTNRFGIMPEPGQWLYLHIVPMGLNNGQFFTPFSQKIQCT